MKAFSHDYYNDQNPVSRKFPIHTNLFGECGISLCHTHYYHLLRLSLFLSHLIPNCVTLNVCGMEGWLTEELSTDYK